MATRDRIVVVAGATGRQGGAVVRHLLSDGWRVRALTRKPSGRRAQRLAGLGAEVVGADMGNLATLGPAFSDAYGVYSVQNPMISGLDGEVVQGKNVADAAPACNTSYTAPPAWACLPASVRGIPSSQCKPTWRHWVCRSPCCGRWHSWSC